MNDYLRLILTFEEILEIRELLHLILQLIFLRKNINENRNFSILQVCPSFGLDHGSNP